MYSRTILAQNAFTIFKSSPNGPAQNGLQARQGQSPPISRPEASVLAKTSLFHTTQNVVEKAGCHQA